MKYSTTEREKRYASVVSALRKDVERCFGVVTARCHILKEPARMWNREDISYVMAACIIMHNMVVEYRREDYPRATFGLQFSAAASRLLDPDAKFEWQSREALDQPISDSM